MKRAIFAGALALLTFAPQAYAENRRVDMSFQSVLNSPEAKEVGIDGSVRFYLAGQKTPRVAQRMGEGVSNKKTNGVGKSDEASCQHAMLSVLRSFQESAKERHANAVIDMVSYFKKIEGRSPTTYNCYVGTLMTGVAMKGTYAKVK